MENCYCKPHYLTESIINELKNGAILNGELNSADQFNSWLEVPECNMKHLISQNCSENVLKVKKEINPSKCKCLTPCESTIYDYHVSYSDFPNNHIISKTNFTSNYKKILPRIREGLDDESYGTFDKNLKKHLGENLIYLDIYFDNMKVLTVEENIADNISSLISDLGGQLGLWLGISILTVVEILYCSFVIIPRYWLKQAGVLKSRKASVVSDTVYKI